MDPGLEAGNESWQVQSVVWINVSADASVYTLGGASELEDLLGGLVLNATGNVTNDVISVTGALTTLDLPSNVLSVLANYTVPNDGAYPAPQYDPALSEQPWTFGQFLGEVWNTLSGVGSLVVKGVEKLASVVWSAATAAAAYEAGAEAGMLTDVSHGLSELPGQAVSGLEAVASAMERAWSQLLSDRRKAAALIFEPAVNPIVASASAFDSALALATNATILDETDHESVTQADASSWAHSFDGISYLGLGIGLGVTTALAMLLPFDLAAGFVLPVIIGLIGALGSYLVPGFAGGIDSFSSQAVMSFQAGLPTNDIPNVDFEALAAIIGLAVSVGDFFIALVLAAVNGLTPVIADALVATIIADLAVFSTSLVSVFSHYAPVAMLALFLSLVALAVASRAAAQTATIPGLSSFGAVTMGLPITGTLAAGADLAYDEHWV